MGPWVMGRAGLAADPRAAPIAVAWGQQRVMGSPAVWLCLAVWLSLAPAGMHVRPSSSCSRFSMISLFLANMKRFLCQARVISVSAFRTFDSRLCPAPVPFRGADPPVSARFLSVLALFPALWRLFCGFAGRCFGDPSCSGFARVS